MKFLIGFRKFTYGIVFLTISLVLLLLDYITGADWIKYNKDVAVAYLATNIGEHLISVAKTYIDDKLVSRFKKKNNE